VPFAFGILREEVEARSFAQLLLHSKQVEARFSQLVISQQRLAKGLAIAQTLNPRWYIPEQLELIFYIEYAIERVNLVHIVRCYLTVF
jgi:hypothetical protein